MPSGGGDIDPGAVSSAIVLGLRRPPLAQIPGRSSELAPCPRRSRLRPSRPEPDAGAVGARPVPPPPGDVLEGLDRNERNNIRVTPR